jgi:acylphosphatase
LSIDFARVRDSEGRLTEEIRSQYVVRGRVQGVGYRDRVAQAARRHGICGYVENLMDGTVHIEAQGTIAKLEAFVEDVRVPKGASFPTTIERVGVAPATPALTRFEIRS